MGFDISPVSPPSICLLCRVSKNRGFSGLFRVLLPPWGLYPNAAPMRRIAWAWLSGPLTSAPCRLAMSLPSVYAIVVRV